MTAAEIVGHARIMQVWHALGGGEIRRGRGQAWWRRGDGWSVSLRDDRGAWYDHRDNIGGGVLDLIQHVRGGSRADALRWLADWYALPLDGAQLSPEERRRYAHARAHAPDLARAASLWHGERLGELDQLKRAALERDDMLALMRAAQEHCLLSLLAPSGIVLAYIDARRKWPEHTAALVAEGERWAQWCETAIALLIGQWHDDAMDCDRWETDGGAAA
jgi:hypothetical protein